MTTIHTVVDMVNQHVPAADATKGTDFFFPNATGWAVPANDRSWQLTVDKTGLTAGVKYLEVAAEYQYAGGWQEDISNSPNGWVGGANFDDSGGQNFIDFMASSIGSLDSQGNIIGGTFPSHARLHIKFSSGFTSPEIKLQTANDLTFGG